MVMLISPILNHEVVRIPILSNINTVKLDLYFHVDITIFNHEVVRIPILPNINTVKLDLYGHVDTTILNHGGFENSNFV